MFEVFRVGGCEVAVKSAVVRGVLVALTEAPSPGLDSRKLPRLEALSPKECM